MRARRARAARPSRSSALEARPSSNPARSLGTRGVWMPPSRQGFLENPQWRRSSAHALFLVLMMCCSVAMLLLCRCGPALRVERMSPLTRELKKGTSEGGREGDAVEELEMRTSGGVGLTACPYGTFFVCIPAKGTYTRCT